ncbi:MAG: efflux RND transporter periplasmic adaptor subunit [Desulfovibrionales bacterium]
MKFYRSNPRNIFPAKPNAVVIPGILVFLFLLVLPSCEGEEQEPEQERAAPVEVAAIKSRDFRDMVRGVGSLEAGQTVQISSEISGIVEAIHFQEGSIAEQGELLFTLRSEKLEQELRANRAALESARSRLENARKTFRRFERLHAQRTVSQDELDRVKTEFETARAEKDRLEAEVGLIRERLEDSRIRAPVKGMLSETLVDPGDYAKAGQTLVTLYDVDRVEIAFTIPERYTGDIEPGQPVQITVDAYPDRRFTGNVVFISPGVDPQTRTVLVKARVDNTDNLLKPGSFATVDVIVEVRSDRPGVPEEALVPARGGFVIYIVDDQNRARRREVSIGLRRPGWAEISKGASVGEDVVVSGQMGLTDGAEVRIVSGDNGETGAAMEELP